MLGPNKRWKRRTPEAYGGENNEKNPFKRYGKLGVMGNGGLVNSYKREKKE